MLPSRIHNAPPSQSQDRGGGQLEAGTSLISDEPGMAAWGHLNPLPQYVRKPQPMSSDS